MNTKKRVAVIFGGKSPEHEVSVITGLQVLEHMDSEKYEAFPLYISKNGQWFTGDALAKVETYRNLLSLENKAKKSVILPDPTQKGLTSNASSLGLFKKADMKNVDVIFTCFHGGLGESGGFQGLFEIAEIPYVGSGLVGSITGMDKVIMKQLFSQNNVPLTNYVWFFRNDWEEDEKKTVEIIEEKLHYPLYVKPANGGSSIGVSKVKNTQELKNAIEVASLFDRKIIVEEGFEQAREINISVMGNSGSNLETSVCEEVFSTGEMLSYDDKYKGNAKKTGDSRGMASTKRKIPADLGEELEKKIQEAAKRAYSALDCFGLARIDFRVNEQGEFVVLEVNTIPGSMSYYLWEASGLPFTDMITKLITLAEERFVESKKNTTTFATNILDQFDTSVSGSKMPQ